MHRYLYLSLICIASLSAQSQSLVYADRFHGNDYQGTAAIAPLADGSLITVTRFYGDVDADPGPGTTLFTSAGSMDLALVKLDASGNFVWGKQIGGNGLNQIVNLKTDASGNIYVFGVFSLTMDVDPGPAVYNITSVGGDDTYLAKYDASGNFLWVVQYGSTSTEQAYACEINNAGDVYITGYYHNTIDFDPGPGTFNLTATGSGLDFLVKLSSTGALQWAKNVSSMYCNELFFDPAGDMYLGGEFWGTVDFDPGPGVHNLSAAGFGADAYVLKLTEAGDYIWAYKISGSSDEQVTNIGYDTNTDRIILAGYYQNTIDVDPGPGTYNLTAAGYLDPFICAWSTDGTLDWGITFGGLGYQSIVDMQIDASGDIHVCGPFEQTCDFDPSGDIFNITSLGYTDIFLASYDNTGALIDAQQIGGTGSEWPAALALDAEAAILLAGTFDGTVDFDPGAEVFNLNTGFTGNDGFLAKYCTVYTINDYVQICAGESYFAGGAWQTEAGDYYDYYTPVEGCDSIVITHLQINIPVVDLGVDTAICAGTTILLDAGNPGADFLWNTGATTQSISVSTAGNYSVNITDIAGCTANDVIHVDVNPLPIADLGADTTICMGDTITLHAGHPGAMYAWNTGAATEFIDVHTAGNFGVTVTDANGCAATDIKHIYIQTLPVVDLGADTTICFGDELLLDAENPGDTYVWNTGASTQNIFIDAAGDYSVLLTDAIGCSGSDAIHVDVQALPEIDLPDSVYFCAGGSAELDAENPGYTYLWNTGESTQMITIYSSGIYSVTVSDAIGCDNTSSTLAVELDAPDVDLGPDVSICAGETATFNADLADCTYVWNTGANTEIISVNTEGVYSVIVTNATGCMDSDAVFLTVNA
ncbi:MAG: hypothetical protein R2794_11190 [Chitinophagales bacterium]